MGQANSTILGYLYQFNKSYLELLKSSSGDIVQLEGVFEDIDILSTSGLTAIQCKYHEGTIFTLSAVIEPILEMMTSYVSFKRSNNDIKYILYAFFNSSYKKPIKKDILDFVKTTKSRDLVIKYSPKLYNITDPKITEFVSKTRLSSAEKDFIYDFMIANRDSLVFKDEIDSFFTIFTFEQALYYDELKNNVIQKLATYTDQLTAENLFYHNGISKIAELSSNANPENRKIQLNDILVFLKKTKYVLFTTWMQLNTEKSKAYIDMRASLYGEFNTNTLLRCIVFSSGFLNANKVDLPSFIIKYLAKYNKKSINKPPYFILETSDSSILKNSIIELHRNKIFVNHGSIMDDFSKEMFFDNEGAPMGFKLKICMLKDVGSFDFVNLGKINTVFEVGKLQNHFANSIVLDIEKLDELEYLFSINKSFGGKVK